MEGCNPIGKGTAFLTSQYSKAPPDSGLVKRDKTAAIRITAEKEKSY